MATQQTGKVIGGMSADMLVTVLKPIGTGENSEVLSATIQALRNILSPSGMFTPELSNETGTIAITGGVYSQSGKVVTMSFQFDAEAAAGTSDIAFDFTLPIPSVFTNGRQLFGSNSSRVDLSSCGFQSISDKGRISIETSDVDLALQNITVTIQYFIL